MTFHLVVNDERNNVTKSPVVDFVHPNWCASTHPFGTPHSRIARKWVDERCSHDGCQDKGSYLMVGTCSNCGTDDVLGILTKGHETPPSWSGSTCPRCGCKRLRWDRLLDMNDLT